MPWICRMRRIVLAAFAIAVLARIAAAAGDSRLIEAAKTGRADVLRALLRERSYAPGRRSTSRIAMA